MGSLTTGREVYLWRVYCELGGAWAVTMTSGREHQRSSKTHSVDLSCLRAYIESKCKMHDGLISFMRG